MRRHVTNDEAVAYLTRKIGQGSKPRSSRKYERQIAGLEKHLETNPGDQEARKRLATAKERLRAL